MKSTYLIFFILCSLLVSCKKNKPPKPTPDYTPSKAVLRLPENNQACYSGTIISPTQSKVKFEWNSATNAETYELSIKNLVSGEVSKFPPTSNTELEVPILQNAPYSWFITAQTSKTNAIAVSDTWKFYNSGPAITSHAPFPAEIISPKFGQNISAIAGKITLSWTGSDVDNDIATYDLYFGTTNTPPLKQPDLRTSVLSDVSVIAKTVYYWKIITKDKKGNTSDSGISQFEVNNSPIADFDVNGADTIISTSQQVTFRDKSLNNPTSWLWSFPGGNPSSSTLQNPTISYPNTGTFNVSLTVSNQSGSDKKSIINYIKVIPPWSCGQPFTDPRDGITYNTVNIDGQCWMSENLKYTNKNIVGVNYNNSTTFYDSFGRLYSFDEVLNSNIAPAGWHIPSLLEANALIDYLTLTYNSNSGGAAKSTSNLWATPNVGANNASGFNSLPSGISIQNVFSDTGNFFFMWTASPSGNDGNGLNLRNSNSIFGGGVYLRSSYLAVRCIKD